MQQLTQIVPRQRVWLFEYPYTYVRSIAMRSALIPKKEYHKLVKMSEPEIIQFLSSTTYGDEINTLSGTYSGITLVERALQKNMEKTWNKLQRISPPALRRVLDAYSFRFDIANIKTILRSLTLGKKEDINQHLSSLGKLSKEELAELSKSDRVEDVLSRVGLTTLESIETAMEEYQKTKNLATLENALDRYYYDTIALFSKKMGRSGRFLVGFLQEELKVRNIITLLSAKKGRIETEKLKSLLLPTYEKKTDSLFETLSLKTLDEILQRLKKTEWEKAITRGEEKYKKTGSLVDIEIALWGTFLKRTQVLEHQDPVSVNNILGFVLAKEIEARNLRILVKAKEFGMPEEFIENELVVI